MKCHIPEISWHNRDPILSVDFQPTPDKAGILRLASGGTDSHVLIWHVVNQGVDGVVDLELAADLSRHQKAVNCVRWSPSGEFLASSDDESFIFIWRQKPEAESHSIFDKDNGSDQDKETWLTFKTLRGHVEDVYDIAWAPDSAFLISGSVDNKALVWDIQKGKNVTILHDHKGFVQGVAWDPCNKLMATLSTDRYFRVFDVSTKKVLSRCNKGELPVPNDHALAGKPIRMFHDDTLQTFFRRLNFSPDGRLIVVPSGIAQIDGSNSKPLNTTYIYSRHDLKKPAAILPSPDQYTVAVRFCPKLFKIRPTKVEKKPFILLPYRMIFAVATKSSVYLYDTQQKIPFALISNIHYTRLTDMAWSNDGKILVVSSTDGFCSIISFVDGELGEEYTDKSLTEIVAQNAAKEKVKKSQKRSRAGKKLQKVQKLSENIKPDVMNEKPQIEIIPSDKLISSEQKFESPEKRDMPITPIAIRKHPRPVISDSIGTPPRAPDMRQATSKTPTPIAIRRLPRVLQPTVATKMEIDDFCEGVEPLEQSVPIIAPVNPLPPTESLTPKTPRRVEFRTINPKSKKQLIPENSSTIA